MLWSVPEKSTATHLQSALVRLQATTFGGDAYPPLEDTATGLLHSLARNRALVNGNKRLALAATIAFLGVTGSRLTLPNDDAYELVMAVAQSQLDAVTSIADRVRESMEPR